VSSPADRVARTRCTGPTCSARVFYVPTMQRQNAILDDAPVANGNVVVRMSGAGTPVAITLKKGEEPEPGEPRFVSHWATCADRDYFAQRRKRR
jgi:hypothetical protein